MNSENTENSHYGSCDSEVSKNYEFYKETQILTGRKDLFPDRIPEIKWNNCVGEVPPAKFAEVDYKNRIIYGISCDKLGAYKYVQRASICELRDSDKCSCDPDSVIPKSDLVIGTTNAHGKLQLSVPKFLQKLHRLKRSCNQMIKIEIMYKITNTIKSNLIILILVNKNLNILNSMDFGSNNIYLHRGTLMVYLYDHVIECTHKYPDSVKSIKISKFVPKFVLEPGIKLCFNSFVSPNVILCNFKEGPIYYNGYGDRVTGDFSWCTINEIFRLVTIENFKHQSEKRFENPTMIMGEELAESYWLFKNPNDTMERKGIVKFNIKRLAAMMGYEIEDANFDSDLILCDDIKDLKFYFSHIKHTHLIIIHKGYKFMFRCVLSTCVICQETDIFRADSGFFCGTCYSFVHSKCNDLSSTRDNCPSKCKMSLRPCFTF